MGKKTYMNSEIQIENHQLLVITCVKYWPLIEGGSTGEDRTRREGVEREEKTKERTEEGSGIKTEHPLQNPA